MAVGQPVSISFGIYLEKGGVNEFDIENDFERCYIKFKETSLDFGQFNGEVKLSNGKDTVRLEDQLDAVISYFVFGSIIAINSQNEGCYAYSYFGQPSNLVMIYSPHRVTIFGDDSIEMPAVTFNSDKLYLALYQCGKRCVSFIKRLRDAELLLTSDVDLYLSKWEQREKQARNVLEARRLL